MTLSITVVIIIIIFEHPVALMYIKYIIYNDINRPLCSGGETIEYIGKVPHIYRASTENQHMNDTYINTHNPIFEALQEINTK
jgi:hypothetical protein